MKKILLFILITNWTLLAWDKNSTVKMYHHLFHSIVKKSDIKVYTVDKEYLAVFSGVDDFIIVNKAEDADIVLITNKEDI